MYTYPDDFLAYKTEIDSGVGNIIWHYDLDSRL